VYSTLFSLSAVVGIVINKGFQTFVAAGSALALCTGATLRFV